METIEFRNRIYTHLSHFILYVSAGSLLGTMLSLYFAEEIDVYIIGWSTIAALCFYVVLIGLIGLNKIIQLFKKLEENQR